MYDFWSKPTTKDAYRLSITSIIIECFAVFIGLLLLLLRIGVLESGMFHK